MYAVLLLGKQCRINNSESESESTTKSTSHSIVSCGENINDMKRNGKCYEMDATKRIHYAQRYMSTSHGYFLAAVIVTLTTSFLPRLLFTDLENIATSCSPCLVKGKYMFHIVAQYF